MNIITRAEAKAAGLKRYFNANPCKHGHVVERLTVNGSCMECCRLKTVKAYYADREGNLRKQKIRRDSNPNHAAEQRARNHARNPALVAKMAVRYQDHAARELGQSLGQLQYASPRACNRGHIGNRFTNDGHCVACNKINCKARYIAVPKDPARAAAKLAWRQAVAEKRRIAKDRKEKREKGSARWQLLCEARQTAIKTGAKTYIGSPCPHGHAAGLRYTAGGGCVACAAIYASSNAKKEYDAAYVQRNLARILARSREYHAKNPERRIAYALEWARKNPEKRRAISHNDKVKRRLKERAGDSTAVIFRWIQATPKVCYWCGDKCKRKYHIDHYQPLSKGGEHRVSNLVIACPTCNLRKNAKDPLEFAASVGRLF